MNTLVVDSTSASTSAMTYACHHQQCWPSLSSNAEWEKDPRELLDSDGNDAMCVEASSSQWNPCFLHSPSDEDRHHRVEWLHQSDEDDDMQESVVQSTLASSSALWYHSRIPNMSSASTSVDTLGLYHQVSEAERPHSLAYYDRSSFCSSNSSGIQPELSELDITQLSPLSGNPLINWQSLPGFSYYSTTMREDEIESLLGQKRPRECESDDTDMAIGCKRRRRPGAWVAV